MENLRCFKIGPIKELVQLLRVFFGALKAQKLQPPIERPFTARDAEGSGIQDLQGELRKGPLFRPVRGESKWDEDF